MAKVLVVDASVVAKWFLRDASESEVDLADRILLSAFSRELELHGPEILPHELCNVLTKACPTRGPEPHFMRMVKSEACDALRDFSALPVTVHSTSDEEKRAAMELAIDHAKGYYDMTYLLLAERLDALWRTAEDKILRALRPTFPAHRVIVLSTLRDAWFSQ